MIPDKINYGRELFLMFSNKPSLISSKKVERFLTFLSFLTITIIFLIKNFNKIEAPTLLEITGVWLTYGGYNSIMNYKDKKLDAAQANQPTTTVTTPTPTVTTPTPVVEDPVKDDTQVVKVDSGAVADDKG
jgi:hypothetical protein